ncbi:MAG: hypothetical protein FVQ84_21245 [Planctomycetes bacterium]|nr:hypothetical protein [Planctomycetota bacterium]
MDELGKCKNIQCKDGIKWYITCEAIGGNPPERFTLRCTSDGSEDIAITVPKPIDMMNDQELCDLIESQNRI